MRLVILQRDDCKTQSFAVRIAVRNGENGPVQFTTPVEVAPESEQHRGIHFRDLRLLPKRLLTIAVPFPLTFQERPCVLHGRYGFGI